MSEQIHRAISSSLCIISPIVGAFGSCLWGGRGAAGAGAHVGRGSHTRLLPPTTHQPLPTTHHSTPLTVQDPAPAPRPSCEHGDNVL
eukprot:547556-Prymnesium_polylepis.1